MEASWHASARDVAAACTIVVVFFVHSVALFVFLLFWTTAQKRVHTHCVFFFLPAKNGYYSQNRTDKYIDHRRGSRDWCRITPQSFLSETRRGYAVSRLLRLAPIPVLAAPHPTLCPPSPDYPSSITRTALFSTNFGCLARLAFQLAAGHQLPPSGQSRPRTDTKMEK